MSLGTRVSNEKERKQNILPSHIMPPSNYITQLCTRLCSKTMPEAYPTKAINTNHYWPIIYQVAEAPDTACRVWRNPAEIIPWYSVLFVSHDVVIVNNIGAINYVAFCNCEITASN